MAPSQPVGENSQNHHPGCGHHCFVSAHWGAFCSLVLGLPGILCIVRHGGFHRADVQHAGVGCSHQLSRCGLHLFVASNQLDDRTLENRAGSAKRSHGSSCEMDRQPSSIRRTDCRCRGGFLRLGYRETGPRPHGSEQPRYAASPYNSTRPAVLSRRTTRVFRFQHELSVHFSRSVDSSRFSCSIRSRAHDSANIPACRTHSNLAEKGTITG